MDQIRDPFSYRLYTYGCKVNTYDSGLIQKRLHQFGHQQTHEKAPVHILNSCAVTQKASTEALRQARRIKKNDPHAVVVITGCGAQVDTSFYEDAEEVDLVVANSHKVELETLIRAFLAGALDKKVFKSNIFKKEDLEPGGGIESSRTRAFLKIQDGCNSFCTFCVIPFARGKSRSLSVDDLVHQTNYLFDQGYREAVLTGVHIGDFKDDSNGLGLEGLIESLLLKTKMPRLRVSSLEPIELSDRLMELYQEDRMCKHFHMSLQSVQSEVLNKMKRNYGHKEVEQALLALRELFPYSYVGMDIIVGFPRESHDQFEETYNRLASLPWTKIHVFPFSQRPGTFAARMKEQVPGNEIHRRASQLRNLSEDRFIEEQAAQLGRVQRVMKLNNPARGADGLSRENWPVQIPKDIQLEAGEEVRLKLTHLLQVDGAHKEVPFGSVFLNS